MRKPEALTHHPEAVARKGNPRSALGICVPRERIVVARLLIVAHESAMQGSRQMKVPQFDPAS